MTLPDIVWYSFQCLKVLLLGRLKILRENDFAEIRPRLNVVNREPLQIRHRLARRECQGKLFVQVSAKNVGSVVFVWDDESCWVIGMVNKTYC